MKYGISFTLYKRAGNIYDLNCRITYRGKQTRIAICEVDPNKWSTEAQRCKKNSFHGKHMITAAVINYSINQIELETSKFLGSIPESDPEPSIDALRNHLSDVTGFPRRKNQEELTLADLYTRFILDEGAASGWSRGTYSKHYTLRKYIVDFMGKKETITPDKIDEKFMERLAKYMLDKGNRNETVRKKIIHFKWFLRWLKKNGTKINESSLIYVPKLKVEEGNPIVFLTEDEFKRLCDHDFSAPGQQHLERTRDVFEFCCLTSLRYSDVYDLKHSDVADDHIVVVTNKTGTSLHINLSKKAKYLLEKYRDFDEEKALPVISDQKINVYIKEVARLCEINDPVKHMYFKGNQRIEETHPKWEVITFHASRRTFISIAIMHGVAPSVVMKFTGHKDYNAMKPYIDIADKARQEAVDIFDRI